MFLRLLPLALCLACAGPVAALSSPAERARAQALVEAKDPAAGDAVAALLAAAPDDVAARILQVRLLIAAHRNAEAVELAEQLVDDAPSSADAHFWLGNAYGGRIGEVGRLGQARLAWKLSDAYERAIALDPDQHEARLYLIQFHLRAPGIVGGDVDEARVLQRELARRDPPSGHFARGLLAGHDGDTAASADAFLAAWRARPTNSAWRMSAGIALQADRRWQAAQAHFQRWTAEDPGAAQAWYQLGRGAALSGLGLEVGEAALKRYLALPRVAGDPEAKHALYRLGQIQAQAGRTAAARASLQEALALDADFDEAREALDAL